MFYLVLNKLEIFEVSTVEWCGVAGCLFCLFVTFASLSNYSLRFRGKRKTLIHVWCVPASISLVIFNIWLLLFPKGLSDTVKVLAYLWSVLACILYLTYIIWLYCSPNFPKSVKMRFQANTPIDCHLEHGTYYTLLEAEGILRENCSLKLASYDYEPTLTQIAEGMADGKTYQESPSITDFDVSNKIQLVKSLLSSELTLTRIPNGKTVVKASQRLSRIIADSGVLNKEKPVISSLSSETTASRIQKKRTGYQNSHKNSSKIIAVLKEEHKRTPQSQYSNSERFTATNSMDLPKALFIHGQKGVSFVNQPYLFSHKRSTERSDGLGFVGINFMLFLSLVAAMLYNERSPNVDISKELHFDDVMIVEIHCSQNKRGLVISIKDKVEEEPYQIEYTGKDYLKALSEALKCLVHIIEKRLTKFQMFELENKDSSMAAVYEYVIQNSSAVHFALQEFINNSIDNTDAGNQQLQLFFRVCCVNKTCLHCRFWIVTNDVFQNAIRTTATVRDIYYTVILPWDSRMNIYLPILRDGYIHLKDGELLDTLYLTRNLR